MIVCNEKRNYRRVTLNAKIYINRFDGTKMQGKCRNLSASGLACTLNELMTDGEIVKVLINSYGDYIPPFEAAAKVVRVNKIGADYDVGFQITNIIN